MRLLIANRGEIALRIARTARECDIETVAVCSDEDRALAAGYGATTTVVLAKRGAAAYLDIEAMLEIARAEACDAVHPGYGFLSENAEFARACESAGVTFVGPQPDTLELFGDKARARALAIAEDVPVVPGTQAPATLDAIRAFQQGVASGSPILLKAVAGGGGRGMRRINAGDDASEAFARCASEAERSFGSGVLFAELLVEGARHIEVQIVADSGGGISHLWERDCSVQRKHQKLIEIAPAPELTETVRTHILDSARRLASAANYQGIGTFEFLVAPDDSAFFIEANPRLQVEHTVTEEITGVDLVEVQLAIAMGRSLVDLGLDSPPQVRGHAIQLRVLAETFDAQGETRPSAGTLLRWSPPSGPGVRVDSAMRPGLSPHPAYDSLIAKLIVSTNDADARRLYKRAARALSEFDVSGTETNLDLLTALVDRSELGSAKLTTDFVEKHAAELAAEAESGAARRVGDVAIAAETPNRKVQPTIAAGFVAISAPLIGTVLEVAATTGAIIEVGQAICVLESMKMEHVVTATANGTLRELHVAIGDVVSEGDILATIEPSGDQSIAETEDRVRDLDHIRPDLAEMQARDALLEDASRPEAVERRRGRGQRTARENLAAVCDEGTFTEYGALAIAAMKRARPVEELQAKTPGDAIITGTGSVNADLVGEQAARCAFLVVDATVLAGTQGFFHHRKIDRILEIAEQAKLPVIFYPEGGGGRPNDTDASDVFVAGLNITSFHAFARLSGKVPRVAVVSGFCFAGSAAFAGCADTIIATEDACLGMGGPAMIEGGGLGVYDPREIGPTRVQAPNGVIDILVKDEIEAGEAAKKYLSYFQGPTKNWTATDQRALRHVIPENRRRIYDVRMLIEGLCDEDSVLELRRAYGDGMITALVRIEGRPVGLVANDPTHLGGAIDDVGAEKAARFIQLCDAFALPILSLCDTPGFMVGPEIEERAQVRKVSRLFVAGANISVPLFCVITRKGYGLGAQAMAGGGFTAPFDIMAWPTGEIGGMGLEGAVNLGFKKALDACETEDERNALFEKLVGVMYDKGKALHAASALEFDAVIDPAETRDRIVRGLKAYGPIAKGNRGFVDTW